MRVPASETRLQVAVSTGSVAQHSARLLACTVCVSPPVAAAAVAAVAAVANRYHTALGGTSVRADVEEST